MFKILLPEAFLLALGHHQAGRLTEAETIYRHIVATDPNHADARQYLGVLFNQRGDHALAVEWIGQAIALKPSNAVAHSNLGEVYYANGDMEKAVDSYRRALALKPGLAQTHANLGNALRECGRLDEAEAAYRQALKITSNNPETWNNLGNTLRDQGQLTDAIAAYRHAILLSPNYADIHNNLGTALASDGKFEDAITEYHRALELKPIYPEAYNNLGVAFAARAKFDQAIAAYQRAIQLQPGYTEAHINLGSALADQGRLDEAVTAYRHALTFQPNHPEAHKNLGSVLQEQGQLDEAAVSYQRALQLRPDDSVAKLNLALLLLLQGHFEQGWRWYESRWEALRRPAPRFSKPRWDGSPLSGGRVLVSAEQGFGDTIQFIRYAPLITQRGGQVVVECHPALKTLLASGEGVDYAVASGEPLPAFDFHCPLLSLPLVLQRFDPMPMAAPYLHADPALRAGWRERLGAHGKLRVGLAWGGNPTHRGDRGRSIAPEKFKPILDRSQIQFVSLQVEPRNPLPAILAEAGVTDFTADISDFSQSAALIAELDLIITVDTAAAHLAGALSRAVWTLLPFTPDWRWGLGREDTPWYPTMRLFRQPALGDWDSVIRRVGEKLSDAAGCISS